MVQNLPANAGGTVSIPRWGRRKRQPTPVSLPGKSHEQRSLVGYSPWVAEESDTTYRLSNNKNRELRRF